ncbi:MAG: hypothetical protein RLN63_07445, partial [Miltoncostaeaceae bacterium]
AWAAEYRHLGSGMLDLWVGWFDPLARLTYNALFATVGPTESLAYPLLALASNLVLAGGVYWYCHHLGRPWSGVLVATTLLWMGPALYTLLWSLNSLNAVGMAALPVALVLLDRGGRRRDLLAMGALLVSMGFGGPVAVGVCAGVLAWTALGPAGERARMLVPGVPLAVYSLAYLVLPRAGGPSGGLHENITATPGHVLDSAGATLAAIGAQIPSLAVLATPAAGHLLLALAALAVAAGWSRLDPAARRRVIALAAAAVAEWGLVALSRAQLESPAASRYLVLGAVPALLIGVELTRAAGARWAAAAAAALGVATAANAALLVDNAREFRTIFDRTTAELTGAELGMHAAPADAGFPNSIEIGFLTPHSWSAALERIGPSFAVAPDSIAAMPVYERAVVDRMLLDMGVARAAAAPGEGTVDGAACTTVIGTGEVPSRAAITVVTPLAGGAATVNLRRFGPAADADRGVAVPAGGHAVVTAAPDRASEPWRIVLAGSARVCRVRS